MRIATRIAAAMAASTALVGMSALSASAADFAGTPTATDTNVQNLHEQPSHSQLPGGGQVLWDGGELIFPADEDASGGDGISQVYRSVAAMLQAPRPVCDDGSIADDGTVSVTVSVQVSNNGPSEGLSYVGGLRLFAGGDELERQDITFSAPPGHQETLTVTVEVPAELLESADLGVHVSAETYHSASGTTGNTGAQWTADQFEATYEFGVGEDCADDIPVVAPAVAAGVGLLALAGYGVRRVRSRDDV